MGTDAGYGFIDTLLAEHLANQARVDEAALFLRVSISVTDVEKQRAITVLCEEIERLREAVEKAAKWTP